MPRLYVPDRQSRDLKTADIRPGMNATAWTVFAGTEPEPIPIEIIGLWKNPWGPRQDVILAKMGGKAVRTNVAGGMSGSPVYIDGKLVGAVALRLSVFSPDAICGITPAELMLEINDSTSRGRPTPALPIRSPCATRSAVPGELLAQAVAAGCIAQPLQQAPLMMPDRNAADVLRLSRKRAARFRSLVSTVGNHRCSGRGAASTSYTAKPAAGWENSLRPAIRWPACWFRAI